MHKCIGKIDSVIRDFELFDHFPRSHAQLFNLNDDRNSQIQYCMSHRRERLKLFDISYLLLTSDL